jgi:hypothetical protein
MLRTVWVTILTSLAGLCADQPERSLGIFLKFDVIPGQVSLQEMKDEVTRILRPTGIAVHWRLLEENQGTESFSEIAVFQFRGTCAAHTAHENATHREFTLATTSVTDGKVQPFSEVACDEVAHVLPATPGDRQKALGKILGRVMVHELFHSLGNATLHTGRGIRKSTHAALDLAWGAFRLNETETQSLVARTGK